jgi:transposase
MRVTDIAMESTGVYWKPVWNVLEGHGFELLLANPQQVKALHGRKSDKRDSQRIAEFLHDRRLECITRSGTCWRRSTSSFRP